MSWNKLKWHFKFHWLKYVGGVFLSVTVLPILFWILTIAQPLVIYRRLDELQRLGYLAQLSTVPMWSTLSALTFVVGMWWLHHGGGFMKWGKSKVKAAFVNIKWDDVIGLKEAKTEAWEVVELLKDRTLTERIGGKILRGILLTGPPGCGKTYLAKAIATEAGIPFIPVSGSEFVEIFVGVGPGRVRKLFKQARQLAQIHGACIIFIDEIDAVGTERKTDLGFGARTEANNTVNQLLVEMDGIQEQGSNVIVIGATNAPETSLDQALLRPGRFDRKIYVDLPTLEDRTQLFTHYLKKVAHAETVNVEKLARRAVWKSPADIENLIKEAALIAARHKREKVEMGDMSEAMERIDLGFKHHRRLTADEKKRVAYHESGHLIATYFLHPTDDVFKASIISRRDALGMVFHQPREEIFTSSRERIVANVKVALGGYVAEKLKFSSTSDGVAQDFRNAMQHAHNMVWKYGMGPSGLIGDHELLVGQARFRGESSEDKLSERLKEKLNIDTQQILQECLKEVEELLKREEPLLDRFADELIKKDELEYDEIEAIMRESGKSK